MSNVYKFLSGLDTRHIKVNNNNVNKNVNNNNSNKTIQVIYICLKPIFLYEKEWSTLSARSSTVRC